MSDDMLVSKDTLESRSYEGSRIFVKYFGLLHMTSGIHLCLISGTLLTDLILNSESELSPISNLMLGSYTVFNALTGASMYIVPVLTMGGNVPISIGVGILGIMQLWAGHRIRQLNSIAKFVIVTLSVPGLIAFLIGTTVCGFMLFELMSKNNAHLFAPGFDPDVSGSKDPHRTARTVALLVGLLLTMALGLTIQEHFTHGD